MIDPHVHLRDWNQAQKETVAHGLAVAAKAGFTHVFDMPNTNPPLTSRDAVLDRLALAGRTKRCKYHVYMGLTADDEQVRKAVDAYNELFPMVIGLKMFAGNSTGNMGITGEDAQRRVLKTLSQCGYRGVLALHCEKESLLKPELYIKGCFETHSLARPAIAETQSVKDIVQAARDAHFAGTLHIAHVSCASTVRLIKEERKTCAFAITFGVTPHHALLTNEDAKDHDRYLKMNPPLREEDDRKAVFEALLDGTADWIESDHAPHTVQDKENGASGIPGFAGMLHLVDALRNAGCTEERLAMLCYGNCAKAFGLELEEKDMRIPATSAALVKGVAAEYPFDPYRRKTE